MSELANSEKLETVADLITALGGPTAISKLFDPPLTPNAVGNWRERGLPPETFIVLTTALNARGFYAPPSLWNFRGPIEIECLTAL